MYKLIYFSTLHRSFTAGKIFIKNRDLPICSNCLHFIEHTNSFLYYLIPSDEKYGKCKKFGEVDLTTGVIKHDLASNCRLNETKCGNLGLEYTKKI
jgi:hypothetical protein